ncbi:NTP pyrophosphatase (non-canonical NTP hydrolase) [Brevundimonas bullata]|uniref:NTP pyrophosphatase (Non-canonical NTP hydrolase) n=1 Tax=Brevundimonas bullata TaxID=13160 RepID=A0A7W7IP59_9CAUL|nr:MazG-like family protein [Brevundimonas bullata]MBB4797961.1 NTP pyrophosphatase (non-canonical NTP hydrolase) [Brevundimonas bullata]MBB6382920.1 NTP pyrophosphatase (non-canonical NTP hydrolase) [Brevundimonas bullata]
MTRAAEHTPSPQSVVVPDRAMEQIAFNLCSLHDFDPAFVSGQERFARAVITEFLRSAPAPSSLAGGEVLSAGERAFTAWAATSGANGTSLMWTWGEMPASQQERWAKIALAALSPEAPAREATAFAMHDGMTTHPTLRSANLARQNEWDQDNQITAAYRGNELAGEVGEACNVIKKLERERLDILGSRATVGELADELADVLICADLIAMHYGIDLEAAVARKFNATSEKVGLQTRLAAPTDGGEA